MSALTFAAVAAIVLAIVALALGVGVTISQADKAADRESEQDWISPHAGWIDQHEIDRRFAELVAELKAGSQ